MNTVLSLFIAASDVCQAESVATSSECDNTAAIIGGVVAVVFMRTTLLNFVTTRCTVNNFLTFCVQRIG